MQNQSKTKTQLLEEIADLQREVLRLKQAEGTLLQERALLRTLIDNIPDFIYAKDKDGKFLLTNTALADLMNVATPADLLGKSDFDFYPPELAHQYHADELEIINNDRPLVDYEEENLNHQTEQQTWTLTTKVPLKDNQGNVTGLVGISRDITERKLTEQALTRRAAQMEALNEISLSVLGQSNATSVYKGVTQALVEHFDMSFARIWTLDEANNDLVLQVSSGEYTHTDGPHSRVSMDSTRKLAWIANQRTPHISNELQNDPRLDNKAWAKESNTVAFAGYPLLAGDNLLGVLGMFSHQPIPNETLPLLQSLVVLVGTFVNTQRLFTQLEAKAQELETVAEVSTTVSTILDADKLLQEVADLVKARFGLYHAHIYQLNESQDSLVLAAGAGDVGRHMVAEGWQIPIAGEKSLVARAARTRQGVIVNDTHQAPDWLPNPLLPHTRSEMAVPMIVGDQVLGVLDVQANDVGRFSDEDAHIQTILAAQVGAALQNAGLFRQTQQSGELLRKRVEELNAITDLGREIAESPPINDLLKWVTARIPLAMQYPDICKVAIKYKDNIYGDLEAIDLPAQIVHALRIGNEVVGRIYVAYTQKRDFLNQESALLGGTANRLSSYIESRNLFDQIQHALDQTEDQAKRLDLLNKMNQELNPAETEDEILRVAARYTSFIIHSHRSSIALLTLDGNALEILALQGEKGVLSTGTQLPIEGTSIGTSLREKRIVSIPNTLTEPWLDTHKLAQQDIRSTLSVPLIVGEQAIGTLNVGNKQVQAYTTQDENLLFQIASMVASAIENRRLFDQTRQRAAELEESTNFLDSVIDTIPSGVFVKEAENLTFVEWNKGNEAIIGLTKKEVLGKSDYDFFPKEEASFFIKADREVLASGKSVEIPEEQIHTLHKGVRLLRTIKTPIFGADGQPKYLLCVSEDITEQKQSEEALRVNEARYRALFNAIPDLIIRYNNQGVYLDIKEAIGFKTFRPPEETIGKTIHEIAAGPIADMRLHYLAQAIETGQLQMYEQQLDTDTATRYEEIRIVPSGNDEAFAVIRDITQQKVQQAEQQRLLAEVQRLAAIVENHPDFIGVGTMDGKALYVNPAGLQMMNLPPDHDITQMDAGHFYLPADADKLVNEGLPTALKEGAWTAEANLLKADGSTIPVEETIGINYDIEGKPASFSITMRDITERKQSETERERLLEDVQAAYRQYVTREWSHYLTDRHQGNLHIEHVQPGWVEPDGNGSKEQSQIPNPKSKIENPIALRGQVVGSLSLQDIDSDRTWTEEEKALVNAVSEQLAQTVENLRLFENTQQRASREQLTREITDKMRAAPDVESIIKTGLEELNKALGVSRTYVKLSPTLNKNE